MAVTEAFQGKRLLWIDDRVAIHRALISRMEAQGIHVAAVETVDDGIVRLESDQFDRVLLDAMLGHESSLPEIPRILKAGGDALLSVCSGFMYQEDLKTERKAAEQETGASIGTIEKAALPDIDEPDSIQDFLHTLFETRLPVLGHGEVVAEPTAMSLSYKRYARLGLEEKMLWLDEAEPLVREIANSYFAEGYIYLLFCGPFGEPSLKIDSYADIPSEEAVIEFARKAGFAPLALHNMGIVDDIPVHCCQRTGLHSYPTLVISAIEGEEEEVHFDNGAARSLMSYEWYGEKGWIPHARKPDLIRVGEMLLKGVYLTLDQCKFVDGDSKEATVPFSAYYIIRWERCRLAVHCGPTCTNTWAAEQDGGDICRYRTGLLGRSLPRDELKVSFLVDFQTGRIRFVEP